MNRFIRAMTSHPALGHLRFRVYERFRSSKEREAIFQKIYEDNFWADEFSRSGPGSSLESTQSIREALPQLVATLRATSLLDIPCGDFQWLSHVALDVKYYGADIVAPLIHQNKTAFGERGDFLRLDLLRDRLPTADIILCRDCLVHLSFREIHSALKNMKRSAPRFLLTTTFPDLAVNVDTVTPDWRPLNLEVPPFSFPPPIHLIKDFADSQLDHHGKYLGLWRFEDL